MRTGRGIGRLMGVAAVAIACLVAGTARGQDAAASQRVTMMAGDADPDWEVVTVRPSDPDAKNDSFDLRGRHVLIKNQPVEMMMLMAFGVQKNQVAGLPEWVKTERFDVDGMPDVNGQPNLR